MRSRSAMTSRLCLSLLGALLSHPLTAQVMQTGDVAKRGLKPSDFPRARQLAPGVLRSGRILTMMRLAR